MRLLSEESIAFSCGEKVRWVVNVRERRRRRRRKKRERRRGKETRTKHTNFHWESSSYLVDRYSTVPSRVHLGHPIRLQHRSLGKRVNALPTGYYVRSRLRRHCQSAGNNVHLVVVDRALAAPEPVLGLFVLDLDQRLQLPPVVICHSVAVVAEAPVEGRGDGPGDGESHEHDEADEGGEEVRDAQLGRTGEDSGGDDLADEEDDGDAENDGDVRRYQLVQEEREGLVGHGVEEEERHEQQVVPGQQRHDRSRLLGLAR